MRTITAGITIITLSTAGAAAAGRAIASTGGGSYSGDMVIWGFLGFCAVIIVGQLLPAFVGFLAAKKEAAKRIQEGLAVSGENRQAETVFDKSE